MRKIWDFIWHKKYSRWAMEDDNAVGMYSEPGCWLFVYRVVNKVIALYVSTRDNGLAN